MYVQMGSWCKMLYASDNVHGTGFANEQEPYLLWLRLQGIDLNTASALCCLVARGPLVPLGGARVVVAIGYGTLTQLLHLLRHAVMPLQTHSGTS